MAQDPPIENKCCGEVPIIWRCDDLMDNQFSGCDVEKIECSVCGRIIYGTDSEDVIRWNNGENDE